MNKPTRIALVEYYNTLPFQETFKRIQSNLNLDVLMVPPSECAELLKNGEVDLSLVPLGALEEIPDPIIVTDYGIACDGEVRTVCIFSDTPIDKIDFIYLDAHSRTSQKLALIMLFFYRQKEIEYVIQDISKLPKLTQGEAVLMIGDKVFDNENNFKFKYDLGSEWKKYTGLPFVFAVWMYAGSNPVNDHLINVINEEFSKDIDGIDEILKYKNISDDLAYYLKKNISYELTKSMKMGMQLFIEKMKKLDSVIKASVIKQTI